MTSLTFPQKNTGFAVLLCSSLCLSLSLPLSALAIEDGIYCPNVTNYDDMFGPQDNPFFDVDVEQTITLLPPLQAKEARTISRELEVLNRMEDPNDTEMDRMIRLEDNLHEIFYKADIEPVVVNQLALLSAKDRNRAITLWCEIAAGLSSHDSKAVEKLQELNNVLEQ